MNENQAALAIQTITRRFLKRSDYLQIKSIKTLFDEAIAMLSKDKITHNDCAMAIEKMQEFLYTVEEKDNLFPEHILITLQTQFSTYARESHNKTYSANTIQKKVISDILSMRIKLLQSDLPTHNPLETIRLISIWTQQQQRLLQLHFRLSNKPIQAIETIKSIYTDNFNQIYKLLCSYIRSFLSDSTPLIESRLDDLCNTLELLSNPKGDIGSKLLQRLHQDSFFNQSVQALHSIMHHKQKKISQMRALVLIIAGIPVSDKNNFHMQELFKDVLMPRSQHNPDAQDLPDYSLFQIQITQFAIRIHLEANDHNNTQLQQLAERILLSRLPTPDMTYTNHALDVLKNFSNSPSNVPFDPMSILSQRSHPHNARSARLVQDYQRINRYFDELTSAQEIEACSDDESISTPTNNRRIGSYQPNLQVAETHRVESIGRIVGDINHTGPLVEFGHAGRGVASTMTPEHFSPTHYTPNQMAVAQLEAAEQQAERQADPAAEDRAKKAREASQEYEKRREAARDIYAEYGALYLSTVINKLQPFDLLIAIENSKKDISMELIKVSYQFIEQLDPNFSQAACSFNSDSIMALLNSPRSSHFYEKYRDEIIDFFTNKGIAFDSYNHISTVTLEAPAQPTQSMTLKIIAGILKQKVLKASKVKALVKRVGDLAPGEYESFKALIHNLDSDASNTLLACLNDMPKDPKINLILSAISRPETHPKI